ncbi:MAG: radical SAM protein [bacterium]|nr:radical SAM protein [bacterium]
MPKYHIITFGCQMNKSDSERIAASLEQKGYKKASKINEADLVVVNMCSVRQSAVDRVFGQYRNLAKLKNKNSKLKTVLTGCILKKDKVKFKNIFDEIWDNGEKYFQKPVKTKLNNLSYIPISNGCNNACSYCVVPFTRGRLVCRSHKEILKETKRFIHPHTKRGYIDKNNKINKANPRYGVGVKEIWLLGQNVNDYQSPADPSVDFAKLLKVINAIPGDFKFFFMSPHPNNFSNELINVLSKCEKFGKYLNLPVQSGDNKILKQMNRNYAIGEYIKLVKKILKKIPEIKLSTDIIVGFPGETKKQFQNTVKLFKKIKFNVAFISKYSPRPETAAAKMKNTIPLAEKKNREKILRGLIKKHG